MEAEEREVPGTAITRSSAEVIGRRRKKGTQGRGYRKVEEGRPIRGRPGSHAGQSASASLTMLRDEGGSPSR